MFYSDTHDDPKAYSHILSEKDAGRAQSRPPGATMGGPVLNGPRSQARASSGPCPASLTALPLEADPRPSRAEAGKSLRLPRFQDLPKTNTSGLIPRFFNFPGGNSGGILSLVEIISGSGLRSDCGSFHKLPGPPRGPGCGKTCVSLVCVRPFQRGPMGCSPPHAPLEGSFHVWPGGSLDTRPRGLSHTTPLGGRCVRGHDASPAHARGRVTPDRGFLPQAGREIRGPHPADEGASQNFTSGPSGFDKG